MTQSTYNRLRDEVISSARRCAAEDGSAPSLVALQNAFDAWDGHLGKIINSPGSWVEGSPGTSRRAAMDTLPRTGSMRRTIVNELAILRHFIGEGPNAVSMSGLTTDELESRLRKSHQTVSSAVNFLANCGWIVDSGFVRTTRNGSDAIIWSLSSAAIEWLKGT